MLSLVRLFATPGGLYPSGSSVHEMSQARILEWVLFPSPGDLPNPEIELMSPVSLVLQVDPLPTKPPGKPKSMGPTEL